MAENINPNLGNGPIGVPSVKKFQLVTELCTKDNYSTFKTDILLNMADRGEYPFQEKKGRSFLYNHISSKLKKRLPKMLNDQPFVAVATTEQLWNALADLMKDKTGQAYRLLQRKMITRTLTDCKGDMEAYINAMINDMDKLYDMDGPRTNMDELPDLILQGVDLPEYEIVVGSLENLPKEQRTLGEVTDRLENKAKQLDASSIKEEKVNTVHTCCSGDCAHSGKEELPILDANMMKKLLSLLKDSKTDYDECSRCGRRHKGGKAKCRARRHKDGTELTDHPPGIKRKDKSDAATKEDLEVLLNKIKSDSKYTRILDSGSTTDVDHDLREMKDIQPAKATITGINSSHTILQKGKTVIHLDHARDSGEEKLEQDSIHHPHAPSDITSVGGLAEKGITTIFDNSEATLLDRPSKTIDNNVCTIRGTVVKTAPKVGRLYRLLPSKMTRSTPTIVMTAEPMFVPPPPDYPPPSPSPTPSLNRIRPNQTSSFTPEVLAQAQYLLQRYHISLNHAGTDRVRPKIKASNNISDVVKRASNTLKVQCHSCPLFKGNVGKKPKTFRSATTEHRPGEVIQGDAMGGTRKVSIRGNRTAIVYMERECRIPFLHPCPSLNRNHGLRGLQAARCKFNKYIKNPSSWKIYRSDNGGESNNNLVSDYLRQQNPPVEHQFTIPDKSSQNGIVENRIGQIQPRIDAVLHHAGADEEHWDAAAEAIVYTDTFLPTSALGGRSPAEAGGAMDIPPLEHFHPWGCKVTYPLRKAERRTGKQLYAEGVFYGYADNYQDGHKILTKTNRVITRGNGVRFHDDVFNIRNFKFSANRPVVEEEEEEQYSPPVQANIPTPAIVRELRDSDSPPTLAEEIYSSILKEEVKSEKDVQVLTMWLLLLDPDDDGFEYALTSKITPTNEDKEIEPLSFEEAWNGKFKDKWRAAIKEELRNLRQKQTWRYSKLPRGRSALKSKWVFKIKREDGVITRYKGRVVACGYSQKLGFDYFETSSPTVSKQGMRLTLVLSIIHRWVKRQTDVTAAFLIPKLDGVKVYMEVPKGVNAPEGTVLELQKSMYGLKQAGLEWYNHISAYLTKELGMTACKGDPCLFVKKVKGQVTGVIALYVDDTIITGDEETVSKIIEGMSDQYDITTNDIPEWITGLKIEDTENGGVKLSQRAYTENILKSHDLWNIHPSPTPAVDRLDSEDDDELDKGIPYRKIIGELLYLSVCTRPDISYAVGEAARFCNNPKESHWKLVKRILSYLRGTLDYGIQYDDPNNVELVMYSDADWAGDQLDRKSVSGYIGFICGGPMTWKSRKQRTVATSSNHAEIIAMSEACREIVWLRSIMMDVGLMDENNAKPTILYTDSESGIHTVQSNTVSDRSKHIEVRDMYVKELIKKNIVKVVHVRSENNFSDILTKPLGPQKYEPLRDKIVTGTVERRPLVQEECEDDKALEAYGCDSGDRYDVTSPHSWRCWHEPGVSVHGNAYDVAYVSA